LSVPDAEKGLEPPISRSHWNLLALVEKNKNGKFRFRSDGNRQVFSTMAEAPFPRDLARHDERGAFFALEIAY
jgi:hypothetical protein